MITLQIQSTTAIWRGKKYDCTVGQGGIVSQRREGDLSTPAGIFPVRYLYFRADRLPDIRTELPKKALEDDDGWCDSPDDPKYNQYVKLPYPGHCERLWREDHLYDLIFILGHNDNPVVPNLGSAIFMHLANEDFGPTEGCIGMRLDALQDIMASCGPELSLDITG